MLGFPNLLYLASNGYLKRGSRVLDVGSQNLLNCTADDLLDFAKEFRAEPITPEIEKEIRRQHYFSVPRKGERTLFVGEFLALTDIEYQAIDVCPAPFTEIVDLNFAQIPDDWRGRFDLILNIGTTEHIFSQGNAHRFIHDALKVGGAIFHQTPAAGWANHGYFTFHPRFYRDLATANEYDMPDIWYTAAGGLQLKDADIGERPAIEPWTLDAKPIGGGWVESLNLNVILQKKIDAPFRLNLETATSHAPADKATRAAYEGGADVGAEETAAALRSASAEQLSAELARRQKKPSLRLLRGLMGRG